MKIFEQISCRVHRFFLGFFPIEPRGGSIARCFPVGNTEKSTFALGIGVLNVRQPVTEGITTLRLLQLKASVLLRQCHGLFELVVKGNFFDPELDVFLLFSTVNSTFIRSREQKIALTFFSSSDNTVCGKLCRNFSYSPIIGQPGTWVGLEQFSVPRNLKPMEG